MRWADGENQGDERGFVCCDHLTSKKTVLNLSALFLAVHRMFHSYLPELLENDARASLKEDMA